MYGNIRRILITFFSFLWGFTVCIGGTSALGCTSPQMSEKLFFYRSEKIEATVTLECNGFSSEFRYIGGADGCIIEFTAPDELCGIILETDSQGGRIIFDGISAEAPEALCTVPNLMRTVFTLSPESVTAIETASEPEKTEETVTKVTADGVTVTLNKSGIPLRAEGFAYGMNFSAKITDFSVIT